MFKKIEKLLVVLTVALFIFSGLTYINTNNLRLENQIIETKTELNETMSLLRKYVENIKEDIKRPSYEYLESITVEVIGRNKETNRVWVGTGAVVKEGDIYTHILTNAHVAGDDEKNTELQVKDRYGGLKATVVKYHDSVDLALIKVKGKLIDKQPVKGFAQAKPQDKVFLVGHRLGKKYSYGEGTVSHKDKFITVNIPTLFGNSGSVIINKDKEVVGIIFAIHQVGFGYDSATGIGVLYSDIIKFLRDNEIRR